MYLWFIWKMQNSCLKEDFSQEHIDIFSKFSWPIVGFDIAGFIVQSKMAFLNRTSWDILKTLIAYFQIWYCWIMVKDKNLTLIVRKIEMAVKSNSFANRSRFNWDISKFRSTCFLFW